MWLLKTYYRSSSLLPYHGHMRDIAELWTKILQLFIIITLLNICVKILWLLQNFSEKEKSHNLRLLLSSWGKCQTHTHRHRQKEEANATRFGRVTYRNVHVHVQVDVDVDVDVDVAVDATN